MPEPGAAALTCRLRAVVRGISPLIWRRLLVPADTTIAGLHQVLQVAFGWSGAYLHRFKVHGREYGLCYDGGPVFRDDARQVRLVSLGLREGERFSYEYNFLAAWHLDLRLEQITGPGPGEAHPRCTGGRRAGPPEEWDGPWDYLERTQPYRVFDATVRAAEVAGQLLDADGHHNWSAVGDCREELAALRPLLGLERFDRRACNRALAGLAEEERRAAT